MAGIPGLLRPNTGRLIANKTWHDQAPCRGLPNELFELQDNDSQRGESREELIARGLRVCSSCPVRAACKSDSSELDRYWTTRGGQPPEGLFEDSELPKLLKRPLSGSEEECRYGHVNWRTRKNGKKFCETCRRNQRTRRYEVVGD